MCSQSPIISCKIQPFNKKFKFNLNKVNCWMIRFYTYNYLKILFYCFVWSKYLFTGRSSVCSEKAENWTWRDMQLCDWGCLWWRGQPDSWVESSISTGAQTPSAASYSTISKLSLLTFFKHYNKVPRSLFYFSINRLIKDYNKSSLVEDHNLWMF